MMTIDECYKRFVENLNTIYEEREASNIADWVFESEGLKRLDRIFKKNDAINNETYKTLQHKLDLLLTHKPVQYVLEEAWFYKMKLKVNEHVLIPRPETEELVEWVAQDCKIQNAKIKILDIGTGSGCIAIALKKELPGAEILAIDVSDDALKIARENALDQIVKIEFKQLDFLDDRSWPTLHFFNIIISNPPYIPEQEKNVLAKNVVGYEPHLALFVSNSDPFVFYKKIADFAIEHLEKNGKFFVEVHENFANKIKDIFFAKGFSAEIRKDIYGRERMIKAIRN